MGSGLGVVLLSFFIRDSWMAAAATAAGQSGWTAFNQLAVQLTGMGATIGLAAAGTLLICIVVEKSLGFRISESGEIDGMDFFLHGEHGYDQVGP